MSPTLPPELLSRIFAHVTSMVTLSNIAICSKQFHDVAIPHLYHTIKLSGQRGIRSMRSESDAYRKEREATHLRWTNLTLSLLCNTKLAEKVRHLCIRPVFTDGPVKSELKLVTLDEAMKFDLPPAIKEAIKHASHSDQEQADWLRDFHDFNEDAVLALLIPALPKLETLDLEFPITPDYVTTMLSRAAERKAPFDCSPAFPHLREACWFHYDSKYGGDLAVGLFGIPSLRSLFLHRIGTCYDHEDNGKGILQKLSSASSPMDHLELHDCRLSPDDIRDILRLPRALKTFIYEIGWGHLSYCSTSFHALHDGLQAHKETLEYLVLDTAHVGMEFLPDVDDTTPLKPLGRFSRLKELKIATVYIFGDVGHAELAENVLESKQEALLDLLPLQLETLHLTCCEDQNLHLLWAAVTYLLQHRDRLPDLSSVTMELSLIAIKKHGAALAQILRLADLIGIQMTLINNFEREGWDMSDRQVERKWGMDENIEWGECESECNQRPVYEVIDLQH